MPLNVRTLCLAMLSFGESTGYDIRKRASEGAYRHFAEASFGSIYPALAKLEADGCVVRREETIPGRPARKVYSLTEAGEREFRDTLSAPVQRDVFRSPFLLVALCAHVVQPDELARALDLQAENLREDLTEIERETAENASGGADWVERFARHTITASLDFIAENRDELIALAGIETEEAEPARFVEAAE